jgi:hypothetical protein
MPLQYIFLEHIFLPTADKFKRDKKEAVIRIGARVETKHQYE